MLRIILLALLSPCYSYVTNTPTFSMTLDRLHRLHEKLEHINAPTTSAPHDVKLQTLQRKIDEFNAINLDSGYLTQEDEELLKMTQTWGRLTPEQMDGVAKDLMKLREEKDDGSDSVDRLPDQEFLQTDYDDDDYPADGDYVDYRNDGKDDEDDEEAEPSSEGPNRVFGAVTPSAFTREEPFKQVVSAVEAIALTNERPQVLEESALSPSVRSSLRQEIISNIRSVMNHGICKTPQPRWLIVQQLAPAADTIYVPPWVRLHRCAPDSGCCNNDSEICAPIEGKFVTLPFYLNKPNNSMSMSHIVFYNHTQCACVSRDTLRTTVKTRRPIERPVREKVERRSELRERRIQQEERTERREERKEERQNDWHPTVAPTEEDVTSPPLMRRCTCPAHFMASLPSTGPCACVCEWAEPLRRRTCLSFSRGEEHFGLRDRVCIENGDCTIPTCKYGAYDTKIGKCPMRKYRRLRYHHSRRFQPEKAMVV